MLGRKSRGDRTSLTHSLDLVESLAQNIEPILENLDNISLYHRTELDEKFAVHQVEDRFPKLNLYGLEARLRHLNDATKSLTMGGRKSGNRADHPLEDFVGGLIYFFEYIVEPVRHDTYGPFAKGSR